MGKERPPRHERAHAIITRDDLYPMQVADDRYITDAGGSSPCGGSASCCADTTSKVWSCSPSKTGSAPDRDRWCGCRWAGAARPAGGITSSRYFHVTAGLERERPTAISVDLNPYRSGSDGERPRACIQVVFFAPRHVVPDCLYYSREITEKAWTGPAALTGNPNCSRSFSASSRTVQHAFVPLKFT